MSNSQELKPGQGRGPGGINRFQAGEPDSRYPHNEQLTLLHETDRAYEAWILFRDMGVNRRMNTVAEIIGSAPPVLTQWSKKYHWAERLANYNKEMELVAFKQHQEDVLFLGSELLTVGRKLLAQLHSQIEKMVLVEPDLEKAVKAYERLTKTTRLLMGQSTENVAQKVELNDLSLEQLKAMEEIYSRSQDVSPESALSKSSDS